MTPSHVPSEHIPLQGQTLYNDPRYQQNLFPQAADQFGVQSWNNGTLNGLAAQPNTNWHHVPYQQQQQQQQQPRPQSQPQQQQQHAQSYNSINQSYQDQARGLRTTSPYPYNQFANHASIPGYGHSTNVDPSLGMDANAMHQQQQQHQSPYAIGVQNLPPQSQSHTVTPKALQQTLTVQNPPRSSASPYQPPKTTADIFAAQRQTFGPPPKNPEYELPKGRRSGAFSIVEQTALAKATKSEPLNNLVTLGTEPFHLPSNRTALPVYTARQSVKDLRKAGADNKKLLAKKQPAKKLPSGRTLQQDVSDSESYDDSSDDSEYTDDEEDEPSPLPATRPEGTNEATRYDIIKATWHPRNTQPNPDKIKASLRDFWEVVNTIHKRWRLDSKAVAEAEEKKKESELPELRKRVDGQRALLLVALKAVLEHAHPDVIHHFGQVKPFFYLCYQFLANRIKAQDYDGELPSTIYEVLVRCVGTMNTELLDETKVIKALNLMKKKASEKHVTLIQKIVDGAAAGSKKARTASPPEVEVTGETKTAKRPASQPLARPATSALVAKKLKPNETASGEKKAATGTASMKPSTAPTATTLQKRPGEKPAPTPAKRGTQIVNKPSALFASLSAASKKQPSSTSSSTTKPAAKASAPTANNNNNNKPASTAKPAFSFAATMAELMKPKVEEPVAPAKIDKQLPPETPEEKTKRLRKESRRHLRVTFRPDASLVAIRYFSHDPEEEIGHDENQVRDAGDVGGEGRMLKLQHQKEMMEDDDDDEPEVEYMPWTEPSEIDFSTVDVEERKRNYAPYGGGQCTPTCPEKEANIQHERVTLSIHYNHQSDIPDSPREPLESQTSPDPAAPVTMFGQPSEVFLNRVPQAANPGPTPDVEQLLKSLAGLAPAAQQPTAEQNMQAPAPAPAPTAPTPAPTAAPPTAAPPVDLSAILSLLGGQNGQVQAPVSAPPMLFPGQQATTSVPPVPDLQTIMATLGLNNGLLPANGIAQFPAFPPGFALPGFPPIPQQDGAGHQPQIQSQSNQQQRGGHKRQRDDGNDNDRGYEAHKKGKFGGGKRHKVVPCKFFQINKCNKGDDCTYIHDLNM